MVDLEVVTFADTPQDGTEDRLVHVIHALAAGAHEVMMVLRHAGHVRGDVTGPFEPRRHPGFDLRLEGAVHGGQPQAWMAAVEPLVQLLRRHGLALGRERLSDDDPLFGQPAAARGDPLRERGAGRPRGHPDSIRQRAAVSSMILITLLRLILVWGETT